MLTPSVSNRAAVNATAFAQGAALVIYAAYNHILISKYNYHLTAIEYGLVFAPEIVALIAPAGLAARIGRPWPTKRGFPAGAPTRPVSVAPPALGAAVGGPGDFPGVLGSPLVSRAGCGRAT